jgi:drug/metabolite transporter (DMT)-like permease
VALAFACLSALCFGAALVAGKRGLRALDARAGAAISIPSALFLMTLASPFVLEVSGFSLAAAGIFALVGLFFPALVTLLTFESNDRLGPAVTSAVSSTAPLFALLAAALLLGERIPAKALAATAAITLGVALVSWRGGRPLAAGAFQWALLLPLGGALVRGFAQALAKAGLTLWPNPFAATAIGYVFSTAAVVALDRLPRAGRLRAARAGARWFALTGALNGAGVLLMYAALALAPVALVAPIVATYPLVTVTLTALVLRDEPITPRVTLGAAITVAAVAYLVGA